MRGLIRYGALSRMGPDTVWRRPSAGTGSCTACERVIAKGETEYEFTTAATVILLFHHRCLVLYLAEATDRGTDGRISNAS